MPGQLEKALQTPIATLARLGLGRVQRGIARTLQRARRGLIEVPPGVSIREDRRFFCCDDLRNKRERFLAALQEHWPGSLPRILQDAADALKHRFNILGSGPMHLPPRIDWHCDFKSGKIWPRTWFENIRQIDPDGGSDIKVPWELSRLSHLVALGKAYAVSRQEAYTREFLSQAEDWEAENPPLLGVNWCCPMEAAIRAINLLWALLLFRDSPLFEEQRRAALARLLFVHGRYIRENLEFDQRLVNGALRRLNGNHYIADLAGLVYLGAMLSGREPESWLSFALAELDREVAAQVLPDGAHWELAPAYHRLVLELLAGCACLCRSNGIRLPRSLEESLPRMLRFLQYCLRPDGTGPLVRGAEDGREPPPVRDLQKPLKHPPPPPPLGWTDYRDHRHLLAPAAMLCGLRALPAGAREYGEDVLWLFGVEECQRMWNLPVESRDAGSRAFPHAGFYVMRAGADLHLLAMCADGGMRGMCASHAHNDALSFELFWRGTAFLSDSGTYVYSASPHWRNRFRSTAFHNTARVDGEEINRFDPGRLFAMEENARPLATRWEHTERFDLLEAVHHGYMRLASPVLHRRSFLLDKSARVAAISDSFTGAGEHLVELFFTIHPRCSVSVIEEGAFHVAGPGASVVILFESAGEWTAGRERGWVSERYGTRVETVRLVFSRTGPVPCASSVYLACCPGVSADLQTTRARVEKARELAHGEQEGYAP